MASQPLSKVISNEEFSPNVRIFNDILEETESIFKQQSEIFEYLIHKLKKLLRHPLRYFQVRVKRLGSINELD